MVMKFRVAGTYIVIHFSELPSKGIAFQHVTFFAYVICSFQNENSFRFVSFFPRSKRSGDFFCFSRPFFIFLFLPRENILDLVLHLSLLHNFMPLMDKFSENLKVQIC